MEELLGHEIESILLNRVGDFFPHHQKINVACDAFCDSVSSLVKEERGRKYDCKKKMEINTSIIADTSSQMNHVRNDLATVALQRKVVEKQINIARTQQEKVREAIEAGIAEEHALALEIVDLEQDLAASKVTKKLKWDGIKRIVRAYKSSLQLSIHIMDSSESCNKVRLIFFQHEKDDNPKYYVDLTRNSDLWRVDLIHPSLKPKHEEQLKCVLNFKKHHEVSDITAFLCILRKIFKQQRANDEAHSSQPEPGKV